MKSELQKQPSKKKREDGEGRKNLRTFFVPRESINLIFVLRSLTHSVVFRFGGLLFRFNLLWLAGILNRETMDYTKV